jgi:peptidylprolyl isomerase
MRNKLSNRFSIPLLGCCLALTASATVMAQDSGQDTNDQRAAPSRPPSMQRELIPGAGEGSRGRRGMRAAQGQVVAIPAPDDVAAVPDDAQRTESGLAFKVLQAAEGEDRPGPNDMARLRYTGWTTDGVMFDSTEIKRRSRTFGVNKVIPGFGEALQLMVAGEKRRFWIPQELAYNGLPGRPEGMLVFDIELVSFVRAPDTPAGLSEPPEDAVRTESGLAYAVLAEGDGEGPGPEDMVLLQLNVWEPNGSLYDSSEMKGEPVNFRMDMTIPAFAELLPKMGRGARWMIWSPTEMARLDDESVVDRPLVFDATLLDFMSRPQTPEHVAGPPEDAIKTRSGLAYKVLQEGTGDRKPREGERVEANYAGWTTDGRMFDSSFEHGRPGIFTLDERMPRGWNEGLTMMVVGEKRRLWIPRELAYPDEKEHRPRGMLVFDVELLSILEPEDEEAAGDEAGQDS